MKLESIAYLRQEIEKLGIGTQEEVSESVAEIEKKMLEKRELLVSLSETNEAFSLENFALIKENKVLSEKLLVMEAQLNEMGFESFEKVMDFQDSLKEQDFGEQLDQIHDFMQLQSQTYNKNEKEVEQAKTKLQLHSSLLEELTLKTREYSTIVEELGEDKVSALKLLLKKQEQIREYFVCKMEQERLRKEEEALDKEQKLSEDKVEQLQI